MKPLMLIEIQTIPISIEFKTTPARTQRTEQMAEVEISRKKGGLTIKSRPIKLQVDTFEARNSVTPSPARSVAQFASSGKQAAYSATAAAAEAGDMLLNIHLEQDALAQLAEAKMAPVQTQTEMDFLPEYPADISWIPNEMSINYEMDKLNFDWKTNRTNFEFIPGNIEFSIKQYPKVIIKYVGGPLYVPPSADPNYEPIDAKG